MVNTQPPQMLNGLEEMAAALSVGRNTMQQLVAEKEGNGCPVALFKKVYRAEKMALVAWFASHVQAHDERLRHPELRRHMRP